MKLAELLAVGVSPQDQNVTYKEAVALRKFLANINQLQVGPLVVQTLIFPEHSYKINVEDADLTPQQEKFQVKRLEDGPIPDDVKLDFYVWLGGPVEDWHNVRAIEKILTSSADIRVGLQYFLDQFSVAFDPGRSVTLSNAVLEALVKEWNDAHGIVPPVVEQPPAPTPEPPIFVPSGLVGEPNIGDRYNALPGSEQLAVGALVQDERGTFEYKGGYFMRVVE